MLYLKGLVLNEKSLTQESLEVIQKSKKIFLESYTVDFPYKISRLEKLIKKKIKRLKREDIESEFLIKEAKKNKISLLVYGSPLFATTHTSLLMDCRKGKVKYKILYNASVFDAVAQTGLQLYKFGKISSIPKWSKKYKPYSFIDSVIENKTVNAHSLILADIGLEFKQALIQLKEACMEYDLSINKLLVCSKLGNKSKIHYSSLEKLKEKNIKRPFCFIIPGKLHFLERQFIEDFTK
ncbi:diphthine synthase [Candidatus Pacearchaeota archaeon]|nr:diphthine synthase [Candidatus Pacearchaeota archaeon]MBD3282739.1 diphthine synthase [Candidatus Pacearchaeota archaeon]